MMAAAENARDAKAAMVCVGAVTGARGLRGEVRLKSFTATPEDIAAYGPVSVGDVGESYDLRVVSRAKGALIARLSGIDDRDAADALKGKRLYVPKAALPEPDDGGFYVADLEGLSAETEAGETLGTVKTVHNFGAGDILEIAPTDGGPEMMLPFTTEAVPEVDLTGRRVVVRPPAETVAGAPENDDDGEEKED